MKIVKAMIGLYFIAAIFCIPVAFLKPVSAMIFYGCFFVALILGLIPVLASRT